MKWYHKRVFAKQKREEFAMKRQTLWKIAASFLLIALLLPIFSTLTPMQVSATTAAPLPYAMESFGQSHGQIYLSSAPTLDGTRDSSYLLLESYNQQSTVNEGIFASGTADGSEPMLGATTEYLPQQLDLYATYTSDAVYFYVEVVSRKNDASSYALNATMGFNFGAMQTDAFSLVEKMSLSTASASGEDFCVTSATAADGNDSSGVYAQVKNVYEFKLSLENLASGNDRVYFTLDYEFYTGSDTLYWVLGTPNNLTLPGEKKPIKISEAFEEEFSLCGEFTPAVLELMGEKSSSQYTVKPDLSVERSDENTTFSRAFTASLSLKGVNAKNVKEAGVLFAADASAVGAKNLKWSDANTLKTSTSTGSDILNFTVEFSTTADDYSKFFAVRPYVVYSDDHIEYGDYYSNSPYYYDTANVGYTDQISVLMIGSSFCTYYLDELVQIAKADGIHLTAARVYYSGGHVDEHWTWLMNDYVDSDAGITYEEFSPEKPNGTGNDKSKTIKEMLAAHDWDHITIQDYVNPTNSRNLTSSLFAENFPYIANFARYLEVNHPNAKVYWHETWGFQIGWGYTFSELQLNENGSVKLDETGKVLGSPTETQTYPCDSVATQTKVYMANQILANYVCKTTGLYKIPSGTAWQIARANPIVGDTLCMKSDRNNGYGDFYHDGNTGGGQYLNACNYYEILTGNSCVGNTWRPTSYTLAEEKIPVLQNAAHQAVEEARAAGLTRSMSDY